MFPWASLLSIGANLLGGLFGNQTSQTATQNQNTNTIGTQGQKSDTTGTSATTQTQTGSTTQKNDQASTTDTDQNQSGTQTQNTSRLDSTTLATLTQQVQSLLGSAGAGKKAVDAQLGNVSSTANAFDPKAYVKGIMAAATSNANDTLDSGVNALKSNIGAGGDTNSAAALLENKLRNSTNASLAGVKSQATADASSIQSSQSSQISSLGTASDASLNSLITSLLNAKETQSGVSTSGTKGVTTGTTVGSTTGTTADTTKANTTQSQQQNTAATSAQTIKDVTNQSGDKNNQDWTSIFSNIGKMFGSSF